MIFNYKLKLYNLDKQLTISLPFDPYSNLIGAWNSTISGWSSQNSSMTVAVDPIVKLLKDRVLEFKLITGQDGTISKTFAGTPNKKYMVSCYVRNNGVLTTALRVGADSDWSSNYFANRLVVVADSGPSGEVVVNVDTFYVSDSIPNTWVGGWFLTEITEEDLALDKEQLSAKYTYTAGSKNGPSMRELLVKKYRGSPYQYFLTMDGVRIADYEKPLIDYGVDENTLLEAHANELPVQLFYTLINSVALMAMLEGDVSRVSHTYPKMQSGVIDLKLFPRVQYFEGFEVSAGRADAKSFANNVTVSMNIYVPITKVSNSMQDSLLSTIVTSLMSDLGFSAIRGSDFFREPEQLYVRQTQYVKDVHLTKKVKT